MSIPSQFANFRSAKEFVDFHTKRLLRPIGPKRATLRLLTFSEGPIKNAICKDFFDTPNWYRKTIGRFLIAHEYGAYERLQGIIGIPQIYCHPYPDMMIIEYLENATDLWEYKRGELPQIVLVQIGDILREIHARGVAHLDIGHDSAGNFGRETNFMYDPERKQTYLIDPAGALYGVNLPEFIWKGLVSHDNLALVKMRNRFFPELDLSSLSLFPEPMPPWALKLFTKLKKI